jgi:hypothetical protein
MTVLDRINAYTAHRMGILTKEERDTRLADDNWPKHPDGTNMTIGEMSQEDRTRIMREASARSRAKLEGSGA